MIIDKAFIIVPINYLKFKDVFSKKSAAVLPKHIEINIYAINLEKDKQPPYGPIYSLKLVELKILKIYIKTNLVNDFICSSKSPTDAPILFDKKLNKSFRLCVNY